MAQQTRDVIDRFLHRRTVARWSAALRRADKTRLSTLRDQQEKAQHLKSRLDALIHKADARLALPRIGSDAFPRPPGTDWSWRPQIWRGALPDKGAAATASRTRLGDELTLFHNASGNELTLRQLRNTRAADLAPFAMRLEVYHFDGEFLSLSLDLPPEACQGIRRRHVLRVAAIIESEQPFSLQARLSIQHGPNTETLRYPLPVNQPESVVEFDLAYSDINENRVEKMWLDLILNAPRMNQTTIRDITFCRFPRAEL